MSENVDLAASAAIPTAPVQATDEDARAARDGDWSPKASAVEAHEGASGIFELPALGYPLDALAPHVSAEALAEHHGWHHAAYVHQLNELLSGTEFEGKALEDIVRTAKGSLFNNAAQHWNHSFLWKCFSPRGGAEPDSALASALSAAWGSVDAFRQAFGSAALASFGSGWTWLVEREDGLAIMSTKDADNPLTNGGRPLLAIDTWEHAYYIDHRHARDLHAKAFWEVIDWRFVESNLHAARPEFVTAAEPRTPLPPV